MVYQPASASSGGGGGGVTAALTWGPDFGEASGNDGITWNAGHPTLTIPSVALQSNLTVSHTQSGALAMDFSAAPYWTVHTALTGSVLGAPFWQSVSTKSLATALGATTIVVDKPTGLVVGDFMLAWIVGQNTSVPGAITGPAGWTVDQQPVSSTNRGTSLWKIATAGDVAASNFTFTYASTALTGTGEIHRLNATHATTPLNASASGTASTINATVSAVTTTAANCMVFCLVGHAHPLSASHTPPASHIERTDFEDGTGALLCSACSDTRVFASAASTGTAVVNCSELAGTDTVFARVAVAPGSLTIA